MRLEGEMVRSTSTTGAIGELKVSTDLLQRGFDVFRSLSPSASCDLAIIRAGRLYRVEVRTGWTAKDGTVYANRDGSYDILAIVLRDPDRIVYRPPIEDFVDMPEPQCN